MTEANIVPLPKERVVLHTRLPQRLAGHFCSAVHDYGLSERLVL